MLYDPDLGRAFGLGLPNPEPPQDNGPHAALLARCGGGPGIFRNVLVVPQRGGRHHGGPIWPSFYRQVRARTCWGPVPIPIDTKPRLKGFPKRVIEAGFWCGLITHHYGHMIADFAMRVVRSAASEPSLPLIFGLSDAPGAAPPAWFWQIVAALGIERGRIVLLSEPALVGTLHVFPQAERLYGGGPSAAHLDLMDARLGDRRTVAKDIAYAFVSRARVKRGGQIAGEGYLEEVLAKLGVTIFYPERHGVAEQIAFYSRVRCLIFSEGSAVHTLQLVGRLGADVAILVRRPLRWFGAAFLRPRVRSLTYLRAAPSLIRGLGPSRRSERHRGITVLDERRLLAEFRRIGLDLAPCWDSAAFRARRDRDLNGWIAKRKRVARRQDEKEFFDLQVTALMIDVRY